MPMSEATLNGLFFAAVGMVGTVAGYFFGWLKNRDNLRHDKMLAAQGQEIESLKKQVTECGEAHARCEEKHAATEKELKGLHERDNTDRTELEKRIEALEKKS
jgi:hypothetical protein